MTHTDGVGGGRPRGNMSALPWILGAETDDTLRSSARRLRRYVEQTDPDPWAVGRALAATNPPHGHRAVVWAHGGDVAAALTAVEHGRPHAHVLRGTAPEETGPVFVFPGQGAVFPGMGAALLESSPVFARRLGECAEALEQHVDWSLLDVLRGEGAAGQELGPDVVEPALFAVMVSLAELWQSHGVRPRAVVGFSLGEIAAACVSGALSLEEATRVAVLWSRAHVPLVGQGSMAIIGLTADEVTERFGPSGAGLDIAGRLAPRSVVVAGTTPAIEETIEVLREEGSYAQKLSVDFPAHSPRVEGQREHLLASLGVVAPRATELPFHSSVTGGRIDTADLDAEYWYRNLRQPVLFEQAARAALADGHPALVELSAHPVLLTAMNEIVGGGATPVIGTLRRDQQGMDRFGASLAEAYVRGVTVDWRPVFEGRGAEIDLPDLVTPAIDEALVVEAGPEPGPAGASDPVDAVFAHILGELGFGAATELPSPAPGAAAVATDADEQSLFDLGFDSIQLVRLQTQLQRHLDVTLESTCIIDHPRIGALVGEIRRRLDGRSTGRARTDASTPAAAPAPTKASASRVPSTEPVAVVGMSFRLPGGIRTRERLWDVLSRQEDVVTDVPADRWPQSPLDLGEVTTTQGGYLPDVDQFDPLFFNISPHEAEQMDPQQRLLLELTWEAFEDAGIDPYAAGENGRVGTFVGVYNNDYRQVGKDLGYSHEAYAYTGNMANAAAGRLSYVYGFRGPSMAIDTACSSSLYALHLGARELKQGGCDLVVAAGVNLILSPEGHLSWSRLRALSPSGRCRSFDAGADGYIRSEGGAVVVLKRLSDAERDGDDILAVLSGSAVNHNGHNGGFTVPNGTAQAGVIEEALAEAELGIEDVSYVEAHGSGTPIGDPQEINALARVFAGRSAPLRVGSVKSNLGHLESAAGMAALCKIVVSLEHGRLPGTLHFRTGNPMVDWASIPIEVVGSETAWEPSGGRRRAGISSFGISGTNAHLIVEEYDRPQPAVAPLDASPPDVPRLLPVSAGSDRALRTALENLAEWSSRTPAEAADIARTLGARRSLRHRAALVCADVSDIPAAVGTARESRSPAPSGRGGAEEVFVFSGQGTQYPGMARELYDHAEAFRHELDELGDEFRRAGGIGLLDIMFGDDADAFRSPLYSQPMIFAVELALARYWTTLGVTPVAVIGHSIGEYAAACFAGVMGREDAVDLVMHRARVMEDTPRNGSMATLLCSLDRAEELLRPFPDVSVAAVNARENVTVSGLTDSVNAALKAARKQRIFSERLEVSHPFHSAQMAQGAERLHQLIRDHQFDAPTIPWFSAQTGAPVGRDSTIDAAYWSRHLVEPVMFRKAVGAAYDAGLRTFVEIGAMATLGGLIAQEFPDEVLVLPSLRKGRSDVRQMLESAGRLWEHGRDLAFDRLPGTPGRRVRELPHTPWDRQRIWYPDRTGKGGDVVAASAHEAEITAPDPAAGRAPVLGFVKQALNQVTGAAAGDMEESLELFSLGVDSLMLVQLGKRVEMEYDVDIPIRKFFESLHTLGAVTDFVLQHRPAEVAASAAPEPIAAPAAADAVPTSASGAVAAAAATLNGSGAGGGAGTSAPGVEGVIRSQLALMEQQLQVLAGTVAAPAPAAPAPAAPAPGAPPVPVRAKRQPAKKVGTYSNNIELAADRLTDEQSRFVRDFVVKYTAKTYQSKVFANEHRKTLADWISSLNFNPSLKETVYPVVSARSQGAFFWDLDGNEYLDTAMGYGVHFFGHQPDFVVDAVRDQLERGYELGPQNRLAGEVAELIHEMAGAERVAFCNTGTEAVMVSVRLARAVSGRDRIARFTTSFHGAYDAVLAEADGSDSMPMSIGIPQSMVDDTMVLTYGSPEALERIREHGHDLAAVLVEPVQSRNPGLQPREFLRELREICTEHGIALIFDEMIVGFRVELGGAQSYFGVESDMSLYGKLVGGGMPIGIIAGKSRYLDAVDGGAWSDVDDSKPAVPTTFFAGTFCKHPLTMAACKAVLTRLRESGAEELPRLNRFTEEFAQRANDYFEAADVPLRVGHFSSLYRYEPMVAADMAGLAMTLNLFFKLMAYHGVYVWERRTAFFSFAHTREHQDRILDAIGASVEALRAGGFDFRRAVSSPAKTSPAEATPAKTTPAEATSLQEKGVYVLSRMRGGNEAYQILAGLRFDGPLDPAAVDRAFAAIAGKHPKLRSRYEIDATEIRARVEPHVTVESHLFDQLRTPDLSTEDIRAAMNAPFDLDTAPLWRYGIVIDTEGVHHLVLSFHHIIADGASLEIILDDLAAHLTHGRLVEEAPTAGYEALVRLQSEVADRPEYERHRQWWLRQFETPPELLDVPSDAPYPVVSDFAGHHHYFMIDGDLHEAATAMIRRHKTTPFVFYLSLWSVLLSRVGKSADLCIGVPMDQRILGSFERTVGMFAQSLPLRISPTPDTRVSELLVQVQDTSLAAIDHSLYAYETLVQELDLTRDYGRNPLFDVNFTFTNARTRAHRFGEVTGTTEDFGGDRSMVALNLELTERDGGLYGDLGFGAFYGRERAAELMEQYQALIAQVVADPDRTIGELPLLDDTARDTLLAWGAGPVRSEVPGLTELFEEAFKKYAEEPAIRFRGEDLTYEHLAQRVDRYAGLLQEQGVGAGDVVGLLLPPSPDLVVAMLAINRVGGAWLPMDVTNPPARLRSMIDIAVPVKVVCSTELAVALELGERAFTVTKEYLAAAQPPTVAPAKAEDLAYAIFTSGSTGAPKGVMVTNGSLANFLCGMPDALGWAEGKTVACLTTPSFDIHLLETLLTLAQGGTVVVAEETDARTPTGLAAFLTANEVDYLQLTPTRLRLLCSDPRAAAALGSLEKIFVGGEAFPENLLAGLRSHESLQIFNVFGPTETCIWSSVKDLTPDTPLSIGTPIANTTFYVLDDHLQLVPEGTAGNLWIGGLGVSPGYLDRPDLTEDLFRDDPFSGGRMYRCGDQAYWKDGEVHCLGRIDNQVKVRGYRIELEEIELAMAGHDLVAGAAAVVREISPGNHVIGGFYQVRDGAPLRPEDLKEFLARSLADYMLPATLTEVPHIPTTTSGKVDRPALARVDVAAADEPAAGDDGTRSRVDEQVVAAWKKVLGNIPMSYDDSFFDLGGNSFSLVLLLEELNTAFPDMLDVSDLFANPTIGRLRGHLATELARRAGDDGLAEAAIPVPATWQAGQGAIAGRVETTLPGRIRDTLNRLREATGDSDAPLHAAFAVTLGKLLDRDEITLGVVRPAGDVVLARLALAGKTDLGEIVEEYRSHVHSDGQRVDLRHASPTPPNAAAVTVGCRTSGTQADAAELLRHFDIVLTVDSRTERATACISHTRTVDAAQMEQLLSSYIKVLGVVDAADSNASKKEDRA
ncbi:amino acid adenylation domain-containing protein [Streptomyces sp. NPDC026589]|uniref:non-ribosomal peptide synthetase/type I polyketide synthase n=1 Tax=Streptomyces sp. NPDC026589 TaxID=3155609 RepID=UPI00340A0C65